MSKEAEKFIDKYTTKDQSDWLVKKKDIIAKFMESYHNEQLRIANVSNAKQDCFGKEDLRYVYNNVDTGYMSFEDWFKEYTLPI